METYRQGEVSGGRKNNVTIMKGKNHLHSETTIKEEPVRRSKLENMKSELIQILDLNGDGVIDVKDLYVIARFIESRLDVNGDGKLDIEDAKTALSILLLTGALLVSSSPASAKGGGRSGGGGRGGSASHHTSHSTYHYYSSSYQNVDYPLYTHVVSPSRSSEVPNFCYDLPEEGEKIQMLVDSGRGTYTQAIAKNVDETKCTFIADPTDHTSFSPTQIDSSRRSGDPSLIIVAFLARFGISLAEDDSTDHELNERAEEESTFFNSNREIDAVPRSGTYTGLANERNRNGNVSQKVTSTLNFKDDGSLEGFGYDNLDGSYEIEGFWACSEEGDCKVRWEELYDDFSVHVSGDMAKEGGNTKIDGIFHSSLGYKGSFAISS